MRTTRRDLLAASVAAAAIGPGSSAAGARRGFGPLMVLDSVHDRPGEALTASSFRDPRNLRRMGFDAQVENDHRYVQTGVTLERYDPRIAPAGSPERAWIEQRAKAIDGYVERCHAAGIRAYIFTDMIVLPKRVRELYGAEVAAPDGSYDLLKPRVQAIHRAMFREIGERFPKLDGIFVRTGEVYLDDVPYHDGNNPLRNAAATASLEEARAVHTTLLTMLREELCERFGKHVVYRTWAFGGIHARPDVYLAVTDAIAPHPRLTFSIKHTEADFHRQQPFNRTLGIGRHRQIVEVQCQREYEGKGAYPNYIAQGVIEGFEELPSSRPRGLRDLVGNPNLAGVWTWSRGGGWRGPYIRNELWCEFNALVMLRWAREPHRPEHAVFFDVVRARHGLIGASATAFRELCLLSARGILLGKLSQLTKINEFWARDEFLSGVVPAELAAQGGPFSETLNADFARIAARQLVEPVLAEKALAQDIWRRIETLSSEITLRMPADTHYLRTSARYGRILHDIVAHGWTAMLVAHESVEDAALPRDRLASAIAGYDAAWAEFAELARARADAATLYRPFAFRFTPPDYVQNWGLATGVDRARSRLARAAAA
jgi:hypothetical protein